MAEQYWLFRLTPGQQAPDEYCTGIMLKCGDIMWVGQGAFPNKVKKGHKTRIDKTIKDKYIRRKATKDEIDEYKRLIGET